MINTRPTAGTPGIGISYYEKDSYYLNGSQATWFGKGAERLGLSPQFNEKEFENILYGFSPDKKSLVQNAGSDTRRAYMDFTFSAPKSISLLQLFDEKITECHEKAVRKSMQFVEDNYAFTRRGKDGSYLEKCDNITGAFFTHFENRMVEPHLHTHALLMNVIESKDKSWRSFDTTSVIKQQKLLGTIYTSELAKELTQIGYKINVTSYKKGTIEIDGVSRNAIEKFSSRAKEIHQRMNEIGTEELSGRALSQKAQMDTRRTKRGLINNAEVLKYLVQNGMEPFKKELESVVQSKEKNIESNDVDISRIVKESLDDLTENSSAVSKEKLLDLCLKRGLKQCTLSDILKEVENNQYVQSLGKREVWQGRGRVDAEMITSKDIIEKEQYILNWARSGKNSSDYYADETFVDMYLRSMKRQGVEFTKGQIDAIKSVTTSRDKLILTQGDAGAGKTFAVEHISMLMSSQGLAIRGLAPTGKAADELSSAGLSSDTIDTFLLKVKSRPSMVRRGELWIIDESSMVDSKKKYELVRLAEKYDVRINMIGDRKQLQAVGAGKIFEDLQEKAGVTVVQMSENRRQKPPYMRELVAFAKSEETIGDAFSLLKSEKLIQESAGIKRREQIVNEFIADKKAGVDSLVLTQTNKERKELNTQIRKKLHGDSPVNEITMTSRLPESVSGAVRSLQESYKDGYILVANKHVKTVEPGTELHVIGRGEDDNSLLLKYWDKEKNNYVERLVAASAIAGKVQVYREEKKKVVVGERVLFLKNDTRVGFKNGQRGEIIALEGNGNALIRVGKKEVKCNLLNRTDKAYTCIDYGYALTGYKAQGATVDKAILSVDTSRMGTNRNDFYVGLTRPRYAVSVYTDDIEKMEQQAQNAQKKESTLDYLDRVQEESITKSSFLNKSTGLSGTLSQMRKKLNSLLNKEAGINVAVSEAEIGTSVSEQSLQKRKTEPKVKIKPTPKIERDSGPSMGM